MTLILQDLKGDLTYLCGKRGGDSSCKEGPDNEQPWMQGRGPGVFQAFSKSAQIVPDFLHKTTSQALN